MLSTLLLPILSLAPRIVAVGDLHGDMAASLRILRMAGLVDKSSQKWVGGDSILVQLGDVLDRGAEEPEVWSLLQNLRREAPQAGGSVHLLLGNHEVLNVCGDADDFVHPAARESFGPDRVAAFAPGGAIARELAACSVCVIIGDTAFVHGALPLDATRASIAELNRETRRWLLGERPKGPPSELLPTHTSPVWNRAYSSPNDREPAPVACNALRKSLGLLGVARVVVGHTPQRCVNSACGGAVWRCDTGLSRYVMGGKCEALEIRGGRVKVLSAPPSQDHITDDGIPVLL
jgi:hypothetical protein